jgi:hypothetical protein
MSRYLLAELTHVGTLFSHSNDLEATRDKRSDADVFCELAVPTHVRWWLVVLEVSSNVRIERFVNHFNNQLSPPFWSALEISLPTRESPKFRPKLIGKCLFPCPQFVGDKRTEFDLKSILGTHILIAGSLINKGLKARLIALSQVALYVVCGPD